MWIAAIVRFLPAILIATLLTRNHSSPGCTRRLTTVPSTLSPFLCELAPFFGTLDIRLTFILSLGLRMAYNTIYINQSTQTQANLRYVSLDLFVNQR